MDIEHTKGDYDFAQQYLAEKQDNVFRWGTRMLRGGGFNYSPCVLDRPGWENYYTSLPLDYDIRNDPVFDLKRSSYYRLGDLGFSWPEPTTKESMRTGYCGPDENSLTRPAFLRFRENDYRPEPAFRMHLTDRTSLHHLRADPLEGVLPFGRQGDLLNARSVTHRDYKWRRRCCARPPCNPTYETQVSRFAKTDLHHNPLVDKVVKFDDDVVDGHFADKPLVRLKKAYNWPINPITREPLGGRLLYYAKTPQSTNPQCIDVQNKVWPCGGKQVTDIDCNPMVIPDQRCQLLAHGLKDKTLTRPVNLNNASALDMRFPTPNWECWEEVPEGCKTDLPSECCFNPVETKGPDTTIANVCPPKPPCPSSPYIR